MYPRFFSYFSSSRFILGGTVLDLFHAETSFPRSRQCRLRDRRERPSKSGANVVSEARNGFGVCGPKTGEDFGIVKEFVPLVILEGVLDPAKGFPLPFRRSVNDHYQSRGPRLVIGVSFAIILVMLVTGTRLELQLSPRELRWGPYEWLIIPPVGSLSYPNQRILRSHNMMVR